MSNFGLFVEHNWRQRMKDVANPVDKILFYINNSDVLLLPNKNASSKKVARGNWKL